MKKVIAGEKLCLSCKLFEVYCRHCGEPACAAACITGAMQKDPVTGIVSCHEERCIGLLTCLAVCPVGCIKTGKTAVKCVSSSEGDLLAAPALMLFSKAVRTEKLTGGVRV